MKEDRDSLFWDKRLSWATALFFICDAANVTIKTVLNIPESIWGTVSAFFGITIILGFAMSFKEMLRRSSSMFWRVVFIFLLIYGYTALQYVTNGYPLDVLVRGNLLLTFVWWIPVGIYAASVKNKEELYNVWIKASYIISFICILLFLFHQNPTDEETASSYNMSFGFKIILPVLFQMNDYLKNKRIWLLFFILIQILMIIIYSNRGPLLAIIFFCIYKFAFESNNRIRKIVSLFILALVGYLMTASLQTLAESAVAVLDMFGYDSRTLTLMAEGLVNKTSGRDEIWELCLKMIEEKPIFGWGLGGEYFRIGGSLYGVPISEISSEAYNPHNGLVQNFVCFGLLGGFFVCLMILLPLFHLKRGDFYLHSLLLIFASTWIIPLCISASGYFVKPGVAVFLFLYYCNASSKINHRYNIP